MAGGRLAGTQPRMSRRGVLGAAALACAFSSRSAVASPASGGHLRFAGLVGSAADTLDPARMAVGNDFIRGRSFYDGLVALDDQLTVHPALATRIESDDFVTWHLTLRRGVTFHDGKPFTAADVVYSLSRQRDPAVASQQQFFARDMAEIRAVGPYEVRIVLEEPNIGFPSILALDSFAITRDGTTDFATANGTGPFICTEFRPGIVTTGRRNPAYWGVAPGVDTFSLIAIPDDMSRHDALLSGDVDVIGSANPRLVRLLREHGFGIIESPVGSYTNLGLRLDRVPGSSRDFVEGVKYLFNREQVRDSVFLGFARIGNDHPVPPEDPDYAADLPLREYDPERAAHLIRKSGFAEADPALFCSPAALASADIAVVLQYAAQKAGIGMTIRRMPVDGYWSQYWMRMPMSFGNTNARPSLDIAFAQSFASRAPMNESRWSDPRFDQLLLQARRERDDGRRRQICHDMQAMIRDEAGICIPAFTTSLDAFSARVRGLRPDRAGQLMGYNFLRHVRFADDGAPA